MKTPRPFRLVLGSLAVLGVTKLGLALGGALPAEALFGGPAEAAGVAADETPAPEPEQESEAPVDLASCPAPEEMLEAVNEERDLLAKQKDDMAERRAEIDLAREQLDIESQRLEELKAKLEGLISKIDDTHQGDVDRLVNLYRNMKPREAAGIMDNLDLEVSVMVLGQMEERDAAPILAGLSTGKAQAVSKILFERARMPGDQRLQDFQAKPGNGG